MRYVIALLIPALMLTTAVTYAADCAPLIQQVDDLLASRPGLDEETIVDEDGDKSIKQMRMEGATLLEEGKNDECAKLMEKALEMLKDQV